MNAEAGIITPPGTVTQEVEEVEATGEDTTSSAPTNIPTGEELATLCANIETNYNYKVNVKPVVFNFKTRKDSDGIEVKRDSIELPIPYPSMDGIVAILQDGGKGLELLVDAIEGIVTFQARALISDDTSINAHNLPVDKLAWEFIANMPRAERTGGGIAKEVWEAFAEDYITVMREAANKTVEQATRAAAILKGKFSSIKTNKAVLAMLVGQLAVYADNSKRVTEFANCVEFLLNKADSLLNVTDEELLASL